MSALSKKTNQALGAKSYLFLRIAQSQRNTALNMHCSLLRLLFESTSVSDISLHAPLGLGLRGEQETALRNNTFPVLFMSPFTYRRVFLSFILWP